MQTLGNHVRYLHEQQEDATIELTQRIIDRVGEEIKLTLAEYIGEQIHEAVNSEDFFRDGDYAEADVTRAAYQHLANIAAYQLDQFSKPQDTAAVEETERRVALYAAGARGIVK